VLLALCSASAQQPASQQVAAVPHSTCHQRRRLQLAMAVFITCMNEQAEAGSVTVCLSLSCILAQPVLALSRPLLAASLDVHADDCYLCVLSCLLRSTSNCCSFHPRRTFPTPLSLPSGVWRAASAKAQTLA
jgi:hypothetical protein